MKYEQKHFDWHDTSIYRSLQLQSKVKNLHFFSFFLKKPHYNVVAAPCRAPLSFVIENFVNVVQQAKRICYTVYSWMMSTQMFIYIITFFIFWFLIIKKKKINFKISHCKKNYFSTINRRYIYGWIFHLINMCSLNIYTLNSCRILWN